MNGPMLKLALGNFKSIIEDKNDFHIWNIDDLRKELNKRQKRIKTNLEVSRIVKSQRYFKTFKNNSTNVQYIFVKQRTQRKRRTYTKIIEEVFEY